MLKMQRKHPRITAIKLSESRPRFISTDVRLRAELYSCHVALMKGDYVRPSPAVSRRLVRARTGRDAHCEGKSNCLEIARDREQLAACTRAKSKLPVTPGRKGYYDGLL